MSRRAVTFIAASTAPSQKHRAARAPAQVELERFHDALQKRDARRLRDHDGEEARRRGRRDNLPEAGVVRRRVDEPAASARSALKLELGDGLDVVRVADRLAQGRRRVQAKRARGGGDGEEIGVYLAEAVEPVGAFAEAAAIVRSLQERAAPGDVVRRHVHAVSDVAADLRGVVEVLVARDVEPQLLRSDGDGDERLVVLDLTDRRGDVPPEDLPRRRVRVSNRQRRGDALDLGHDRERRRERQLFVHRGAGLGQREPAPERGEADETREERFALGTHGEARAVAVLVLAQAPRHVQNRGGGATRHVIRHERRRAGGDARQALAHRRRGFDLIVARQAHVQRAAFGDQNLHARDRFVGQVLALVRDERLQRAHVRAHVPGLDREPARHRRKRRERVEKRRVVGVDFAHDCGVAEARGGVHLGDDQAARGERARVRGLVRRRPHPDLARLPHVRDLVDAQVAEVKRVRRRDERDDADVPRGESLASVRVRDRIRDPVHPRGRRVELGRVADDRVREVAVLVVRRGRPGVDPDGVDEDLVSARAGAGAEEADPRASVRRDRDR
eukprot:30137-Pelagococcus_subviridis.AAC.2